MPLALKQAALVPDLGKPFSALALGTAFYRLEHKRQCFEILDEYLRLGGRVVDSARTYGESESVIGEWMGSRGTREQVIVITKCAHGNGQIPASNFEEVVSEELRSSVEQLRTDYVDLLMLHRDDPGMPVSRIMNRLHREIESGRVRALGASNWTYPRVDEANTYAREHGISRFAVVSNNLSLAVPAAPFYPGLVSVDRAGEQWHQATGIPLLAWSSQARGFFSGRYAPELRDRCHSLDDAFTKRMIEVYGTDDNFERLRRSRQLGERKGGYSPVQVALAWLLHKPFPLVAIVGPRTPEEVRSCVEATALRLTQEEIRWVNLEM